MKLLSLLAALGRSLVALRASAWIETFSFSTPVGVGCLSHSARVRGLKHYSEYDYINWGIVALRASAWIETVLTLKTSSLRLWSHSARVRGLKHFFLRARKGKRVCRTPRECVD